MNQQKNEAGSANRSQMLSNNLTAALAQIRTFMGNSSDFVVREFKMGTHHCGALIYIDGLVDSALIDCVVLSPLMRISFDEGLTDPEVIRTQLVAVSSAATTSDLDTFLKGVLAGKTGLLIDGMVGSLLLDARKWEKRSVEEPGTENVVRGPRISFTESLQTNTAMLRRMIQNPNLRFETITLGEQTNTAVCIAYIEGIVREGLVTQIEESLQALRFESVLDSGYLESSLSQSKLSIFKTVNSTERPDATAGRILEGRAAIIVDGSPFVLTVPHLFIENFQSAEDYNIRAYYASLLRSTRVLAFLMGILAPAIYVALTSFHQELIPTTLLFTLVAGHENIPFPSMIEAFIMLVIFDIMREAGIRLPKAIGSAVTIVGALVLGESAVSAGLIGPFMVIVVSLTAIASFVVPSQYYSILLIRYFLLLVSGVLGGFGITMALLLLLTHLASVESFGVAYLSPLSPLNWQGIKDSVFRMSFSSMKERPAELGSPNRRRR